MDAMEKITGNRYLIYQLLHREVTFEAHCVGKKRKSFTGIVEKVSRNIFENSVLVTVSGQRYSFKEPAAILQDDDCLVFVYGDISGFDDSDDALFKDVRMAAYGDTVNDIIRRSVTPQTKTMRFEIGPKVQERRPWNRKASQT